MNNGKSQRRWANGDTLNNPTNFDAKPLLRIYGNGTVTINGSTTITTTNNSGSNYIDIDSERMQIYRGDANMSANVAMTDFPSLIPDDNTIEISSTSVAVYVTPRWWML